MRRISFLLAAVIGFGLITSVMVSNSVAFDLPHTIEIFDGGNIHFFPDSADKFDKDGVSSTDNGRSIHKSIRIPKFDYPLSITGVLTVHPIPKDELVVCDKWDRAGNVRLVTPQGDIELIKFITSYGGETSYEVDLSHLQPLLGDSCEFVGFIDTWVSPAWTIDFSLVFDSLDEEAYAAPKWAQALTYVPSFSSVSENNGGVTIEAKIPNGLEKVKLFYLVSGHCTDGRDADEFVSKDNVIRVDKTVVYRYQPWRDDCRQVREINPYTRRWSDGYWSSDYSRSGWCPGLMVDPLVLDLTDHLTAGEHEFRFMIEGVRPQNEAGDYGYWRVSAYLVGW